jgi:putative heme-binding domain-containing protein
MGAPTGRLADARRAGGVNPLIRSQIGGLTPPARPLLVLLALLTSAGPLFAQANARVPDPDPELERRSFQVADGFEVNLFAADPLLAKPIQMSFDAAGRLWVACSEAYPQIKPGQKQNDKILVLEDTKGTGRADKVTVFAEGLLIPTGLEPGDGGVYVVDSTDLLHLSDTDGDGKADRRRVVLSGFGTEDTHHMVHALRWGPDGMLYFNQSTYIHSHIETPHGPRRLGGGGIWQFRPETLRLEVFARGLINPWGHHFDRWGQSFATDGAGGEGINYIVPGGSYAWTPGATRILPGLNPGSPKYCGLEVLSGSHLPESWRGSLLTNDFRGHRVCRFVVTPEGSGYVSREQPELIKTAHEAFRPIDVKMGPDGAIYVADWYNPIIQHGEVDFRDPRRDHTHGRIWRVTARGRPLAKRPHLVGAKTTELLEALKAPEDWTRHFARRTLKERGAREVLPELAAWVKAIDAGDPANEPLLLEALWTYQSLDVVEPQVLGALLSAHDYRVRAAATRVLSAWHGRLQKPLELLAARVADEHPQVRLEAVRALGQIPDARAAESALVARDRPLDSFLDYGLWLTMRELEPQWMPALQQGRFYFGKDARRLLFALQAVASREAVKPLVELVQSGKVPPEGEEGVFTLIATFGGPEELALLLDRVLKPDGAPAGRRLLLLTALEKAARERRVRPAGDFGRVADLLKADNESVRAIAARVAGLWGVEGARPVLLEWARDSATKDAPCQAAIDGLAALGGKASRDVFDQLAGGNGPPAQRRMALVALAGLDLEAAAGRAVDVLTATPTPESQGEIFDAFLGRKNGASLLARALEGRKLPPDTAKVGIRTARTTGRDVTALTDALTKAGSLTFGAKELTPGEMERMVADVARLGDAARGERVFRRRDQTCLKCHAIGGAGGQVGPDLSSIGASAPVDYLIDSLLLPNKAVKENYHAMLVSTKKGQLYTGIKVRETKDNLVLRTAEDKELTIAVKDIDERAMGGSLMPAGLTDTLTRGELLDLVRFLSELGKVGLYSLGKVPVARRWEVLEAIPEGKSLSERGGFEAVPGNEPGFLWGSAYSTVAGELPLDDIPRIALAKGMKAGVVRCQLDVSTEGTAVLRLNGTGGLRLWLDQTALPLKDDAVELKLSPGLHTLTFAVDFSPRKEGLRCELDDKPGATARVRLVGGK